ncbi:MAG: IS701 family transposase, partial [Bacteroidota bacterium]
PVLFKFEQNRANCQEISDSISRLDQQRINHFINSDHWSFRELMDEVSKEASTLFKQVKKPVGLLIDEVGFRKKGNHSACVARQYLGCVGKVDNGQVAVAAGLCQGQVFAPIDMRLFMPEEWGDDSLRREKCNIPEDEKHLSKPELAQKMIKDAVGKGIDFDFVNFDALYGNTVSLLGFLENRGLDFIGDVRSNLMVYFDYDKEECCNVGQYFNCLSNEDFEQITIRQSTKGTLKAWFHYTKVQLLADRKWLDLILLIRKDTNGKVKYSLSNMHDDHIVELAEKQGQRIFVEQMFKEAKNQVGMGDYQIRGWNGFHNHMALCMMAMLLIAKIKMEYKEEVYTAATVRKLISLCIKSKMEDPKAAINIIFEQHSRYIRQIERDGFFSMQKLR